MTNAATQDDILRLLRELSAVVNQVRSLHKEMNDHLKRIHNDIREQRAAIIAIAEERVFGESKYNSLVSRKIDGLKQELNTALSEYKQCLDDVLLVQQKIIRKLDD